MSDMDIKQVNDNDDISLIDLFAVFWRFKWLIIIPTFLAAVGIFLYYFLPVKFKSLKNPAPNVYTAKAEMLINNTASSSNNLQAMLSASSLSGILGNGKNGPSNSDLATYLIQSPTIQDKIIDKFYRSNIEKQRDKYFAEMKEKGVDISNIDWKFPTTDTRLKVTKKIKTSYDKNTGVYTISVTDKNPKFACDLINYTVQLLEERFAELGIDRNKITIKNLEANIENTHKNIIELQTKSRMMDYSLSDQFGINDDESYIVIDNSMLQVEIEVQKKIYSNLKTQYESLKVSMSNEQPVFQILEYAEIPDKKSGPDRKKKCIIFVAGVFILTVFTSLALDLISKAKKNPEVVEKFNIKGKRK